MKQPITLIADDVGHAAMVAACLRAIGFTRIDVIDREDAVQGKLSGLLIGTDQREFLDVVRRVRARRTCAPILVLVRAGGAAARVRALRAGADDALDFPCHNEELTLRIARLQAYQPPPLYRIQVGPLTIDMIDRSVMRGGREISLLPRELALLVSLCRCPGEIVSRQTLLRDVWKLRFDPGSNVVEVNISRLRAKLDHGFADPVLETVKGMGYRLRLDATDTLA